MKNDNSRPQWLYALAAGCMLGHYAYTCCHCFWAGHWEEIFWLSHVGTAVGGFGALLRKRYPISVALVALLLFHACWVCDVLTWSISGTFPLGVAAYLPQATWGSWIQSANHFYSVPFLVLLSLRLGGVARYAWAGAGGLFGVLVLVSYFALPPCANVNSAHGLWLGLEQSIFARVGHLPPAGYLTALIGLNTLVNFWVVNLLLRLFFHQLSLNIQHSNYGRQKTSPENRAGSR